MPKPLQADMKAAFDVFDGVGLTPDMLGLLGIEEACKTALDAMNSADKPLPARRKPFIVWLAQAAAEMGWGGKQASRGGCCIIQFTGLFSRWTELVRVVASSPST